MSKFDEMLTKYQTALSGISKSAVDADQLNKVAKGLGPSIYLKDASLVSCTDQKELDRVIGAFVWTRTHVVAGRRVIALDGKTVRGARTANAVAPHLVAAFDHATGTVVGQVAVAKSNEIPSYQHGTRPARLFRPDRCRRDRGRDTYPGRDQQPSAGDHRRRRGLLVHGEEEPAHAAPGVHGPALGRRPQLPGHPPADIHKHAAG